MSLKSRAFPRQFIGQIQEVMLKKRANCWEYFKCGREPGGLNSEELGICSAATAAAFDGINHGRMAGRVCWAIIDSRSTEERVDRFCNCMECPFFSKVIAEEGRFFELGVDRDLPQPGPGCKHCGSPA